MIAPEQNLPLDQHMQVVVSTDNTQERSPQLRPGDIETAVAMAQRIIGGEVSVHPSQSSGELAHHYDDKSRSGEVNHSKGSPTMTVSARSGSDLQAVRDTLTYLSQRPVR